MVSDTVREQHFYVAIAKHLYLDAGHGLVSVREAVPVAQAAEHGLEPLVLYGLTAAGLPVRWMCFSRLDMPLDLGEVLASGWAQARSLGGVPDVLKVSRGLAAACPGLEQGLRSVGVRLVVADTREKSLPASMRAAQVEARNLVDFRGPVASIEGLSRRVAEACSEGASDWRINCERIAVREPMRQLRDEPFRDLATKIGCRLNWEQGAWLRSWEASLGPRREQVLYGVRGGGASLVPAGNAAEGDDDLDNQEDEEVADFLRGILHSWPCSEADVAAAAGITVKELKWLASGRLKFDDRQEHKRLRSLLSIDYDDYRSQWTVEGPYVLVARKEKSLEEAYINCTHGGDASPYEILPGRGAADPSWRYFAFNGYAGGLVIAMVPRGDIMVDRIDRILMNFRGEVEVPIDLYRDVVATCGRACRSTLVNAAEMTGLEERHHAFFERLRYGDLY